MKTFQFQDYIYIDQNFNITQDDFKIHVSEPHINRSLRRIHVNIDLKIANPNLKEDHQLLNMGDKNLRRSYQVKFDFRGRRNEKQKEAAVDNALNQLKSKIDSGEYVDRAITKYAEYFQSRLERKRKQYMNETESFFIHNNPITWDQADDHQLDEIDGQLDEINQKMKQLQQKRAELKKQKHLRKNKIFADYLNENSLNQIWDEDNVFSPAIESKIKGLAQKGELFGKSNQLNALI